MESSGPSVRVSAPLQGRPKLHTDRTAHAAPSQIAEGALQGLGGWARGAPLRLARRDPSARAEGRRRVHSVIGWLRLPHTPRRRINP